MRIKFLALALVASLVAVSAAVAKDHPGQGPQDASGRRRTNCKLANVELKGMLAADVDPADGDTSFVMVVKRSNKHGRAFKAAGSATIMVDAKTKIRRRATHTLGALAPNDRVQRDGQGLQERPDGRRHARTDCAQDQRAPGKAEHPASRRRARKPRLETAIQRRPKGRLWRVWGRRSIVRTPPGRLRPSSALRSVPFIRYSRRFAPTFACPHPEDIPSP